MKGREEGTRITWIGLWANIALTTSKGVGGYLLNSPVLLADAFHSGSDFMSDITTLFTFKATKKPNKVFPFGYGKVESIGTFCVSGLLAVGALGICSHSIHTLVDTVEAHSHVVDTSLGLGLAFVSVAVKEGLYQWTYRVGKKLNSPVLMANAWHHRSDAASSAVAIAGLMGSQLGYHYLDPVGGLVVAGMIMKAAVDVGKESVYELLDASVSSGLEDKLKILLLEKGDPLQVSSVQLRKFGPYYHADVTINPQVETSIEEILKLSKSYEKTLLQSKYHINHVTVSFQLHKTQ